MNRHGEKVQEGVWLQDFVYELGDLWFGYLYCLPMLMAVGWALLATFGGASTLVVAWFWGLAGFVFLVGVLGPAWRA